MMRRRHLYNVASWISPSLLDHTVKQFSYKTTGNNYCLRLLSDHKESESESLCNLQSLLLNDFIHTFSQGRCNGCQTKMSLVKCHWAGRTAVRVLWPMLASASFLHARSFVFHIGRREGGPEENEQEKEGTEQNRNHLFNMPHALAAVSLSLLLVQRKFISTHDRLRCDRMRSIF